MKPTSSWSALLLTMLSVPVLATAKPWLDPKTGYEINVPDDWNESHSEHDAALRLFSPDRQHELRVMSAAVPPPSILKRLIGLVFGGTETVVRVDEMRASLVAALGFTEQQQVKNFWWPVQRVFNRAPSWEVYTGEKDDRLTSMYLASTDHKILAVIVLSTTSGANEQLGHLLDGSRDTKADYWILVLAGAGFFLIPVVLVVALLTRTTVRKLALDLGLYLRTRFVPMPLVLFMSVALLALWVLRFFNIAVVFWAAALLVAGVVTTVGGWLRERLQIEISCRSDPYGVADLRLVTKTTTVNDVSVGLPEPHGWKLVTWTPESKRCSQCQAAYVVYRPAETFKAIRDSDRDLVNVEYGSSWNSWNVSHCAVSDEKKQKAEQAKSSLMKALLSTAGSRVKRSTMSCPRCRKQATGWKRVARRNARELMESFVLALVISGIVLVMVKLFPGTTVSEAFQETAMGVLPPIIAAIFGGSFLLLLRFLNVPLDVYVCDNCSGFFDCQDVNIEVGRACPICCGRIYPLSDIRMTFPEQADSG